MARNLSPTTPADPSPATSPAPSRTGHEYDAIVVGARVAGAATGMLLARSGRRVLVVDRRRPGGDTLSTHALMRAGVLQLRRWGLLDRVIAAGTPAIRRTVMHYGDQTETVEIKLKAGVEALYAPRRTVLDTLLVEAAEESGAEVRFGVAVDELLWDSINGTARVVGIAGRDAAGEWFESRARFVVGADGIRSVVAREAGAATLAEGSGATAVVYGYYSGLGDDIGRDYEFWYRPGVSAGLIPTNDGQVCVWAGTSPARFLDQRSEPDMGFARTLAETAPEIAERVSAGRLEGRLHGFPGVPGFVRQAYGAGWALVGDASHFKDPISTHGITDAMRDAEFLARALDEALAGGPAAAEAAALERYRETRDRLSHRLHAATDAVARYEWTMDTVRDLLIEMARAMTAEVDELQALDAPPQPAGGARERSSGRAPAPASARGSAPAQASARAA